MSEANTNGDDFVDIVTNDESAEPLAVQRDPELEKKVLGNWDQEAIDKAVASHVSPLKATPKAKEEAEFDEELSKAIASRNMERRQQELQRQMRLRLVKEDKEVQAAAPAFLRELSGIEAFSRSYTVLGICKVTFQNASVTQLDEVRDQGVRDMCQDRIVYTAEAKFNQPYRLAVALKSFTMSDPQSGKIIRTYDYQAHTDDVRKHVANSVTDSDFLIRRRLDYLLTKVFPSGPIYAAVMEKFMQFDALLGDLAYLAAEDPDFFVQCLAGESS